MKNDSLLYLKKRDIIALKKEINMAGNVIGTIFGFTRYLGKVKEASGKKKVFYAILHLILTGVAVGLLYLAVVLLGKNSLPGIIVGAILGIAALLCLLMLLIYEIILIVYGFRHFGQKTGKSNLGAAVVALLTIVGAAITLVLIVLAL